MYEILKCYETSRFLCLKTDALGVGLGVGLLQVRDGINYRHDEVPDNAILLNSTCQQKPVKC